ncbi:TPA: hypothetical protein ACQOKP_001912, partial [Streptococcus pyogenes]
KANGEKETLAKDLKEKDEMIDELKKLDSASKQSIEDALTAEKQKEKESSEKVTELKANLESAKKDLEKKEADYVKEN